MASVVPMPTQKLGIVDSFTNFLAGFGMWGRDKAMSQQWTLNLLNPQQLEFAYRADWVARKIVQLPAFDAARAWRSWEATQQQTKKLEETEKNFGYQLKLYMALERARLYGGAAIIIGVDNGKFNEELEVKKVGKDDLKFMHVVSRWMLAAGARAGYHVAVVRRTQLLHAQQPSNTTGARRRGVGCRPAQPKDEIWADKKSARALVGRFGTRALQSLVAGQSLGWSGSEPG